MQTDSARSTTVIEPAAGYHVSQTRGGHAGQPLGYSHQPPAASHCDHGWFRPLANLPRQQGRPPRGPSHVAKVATGVCRQATRRRCAHRDRMMFLRDSALPQRKGWSATAYRRSTILSNFRHPAALAEAVLVACISSSRQSGNSQHGRLNSAEPCRKKSAIRMTSVTEINGLEALVRLPPPSTCCCRKPASRHFFRPSTGSKPHSQHQGDWCPAADSDRAAANDGPIGILPLVVAPEQKRRGSPPFAC